MNPAPPAVPSSCAQAARPTAILDLIRSAENFRFPSQQRPPAEPDAASTCSGEPLVCCLWCAASGVLRPLPVFDLPSLGQGGFGCEGA